MSGGEPTLVATVALLAAAVSAGADVRSALAAVGRCVGGEAAALETVASALHVGVPWHETWARCPAPYAAIGPVLHGAWTDGASPVEPLRAFANSCLETARMEAQKAAAELGVRLALPLTMCLLPAFVLAGVVPLLLAVAGTVVGEVVTVQI